MTPDLKSHHLELDHENHGAINVHNLDSIKLI